MVPVPTTSLIPIRDDNPTRNVAYVTLTLVVVNVAAWLMEPSLGAGTSRELAAFFYRWGLVPAEITQDGLVAAPACGFDPCKDFSPWVAVLTSMFLHGGFLHLAGNMLFLWVFGNNIEDTLGGARFLAFYLACGVAAALAHVATNADSVVPTVGASGAVAGMLGAYIVLFPHARVVTIVPIFFLWQFIELPALVVLGYWFVSQFFIGFTQPDVGGGVAWMAHVGGFVTGAAVMAIVRSVRRLNPPPPPPPLPWREPW